MTRFLLIRHGKTQGNLERRYVGDPEEPLCQQGIEIAKTLTRSGELPFIDVLYSGQALRCRQTAEILFPKIQYKPCQMAEIDFGIFKNKNADDLLGNKEYETWLNTNCMGDIPEGENVQDFKERSCEIFLEIAQKHKTGTTAFIIHGGNIMAIMERFALPKQNFYDYHLSNCGYFFCQWENNKLRIERKGNTV